MDEIKRVDEMFQNVEDRLIVTAVMYNSFFVNDTALNFAFNALGMLEQTEYWRQGVRRWGGVVRQYMRAYNMTITRKIGAKYMSFIADLHDRVEERLQLDIIRLRNACLLRLGKRKDAGLLSEIFLAGEVLLGACHNNDECFGHHKHLNYLQPRFRFMRLTNVANAFVKMQTAFNRIVGDEYCKLLTSDNVVANGFQALANKLRSADDIVLMASEQAEEWEKEHDEIIITI